MTEVVNVHEAKTHLSRLLEAVERGEEIVIARNRVPVARLVPIERTRRTFGVMQFEVPDDFDAPLPEDELARWE
ncbi:MAG: type II toxin-antitoxin system Phd/YefM family antitoxin [Propionibacterium sp.]|nr:type II toxin-antitoxin system Phd/YefM family antitoxin [Propionibacterium sp.]